MNLLIDENLSPKLVQLVAAKGVAAVHVAHVGMAGATDLHLAGSVEVHPGLVVLRTVGGLSREEQWAWVEPVLDWLIEKGETLVNKAVIVTGKRRFSVTELPPP